MGWTLAPAESRAPKKIAGHHPAGVITEKSFMAPRRSLALLRTLSRIAGRRATYISLAAGFVAVSLWLEERKRKQRRSIAATGRRVCVLLRASSSLRT